MRKQVKISEAEVNYKIRAWLLDVLFMVASAVILYFPSFYGFFKPLTNYNSNQVYINEIKEEYHLNLGDKKSYQEYEAAIKDFYLVQYREELEDHFSQVYGQPLSAEHIYNVKILQLPLDPKLNEESSYKNNYFKYKSDENGFLVDEIAETLPKNNSSWERNMKIVFLNGYESLHVFTCLFNKQYETAHWQNIYYKCYSRLLGCLISLAIFGLIIPLTNKYGQTLGEKITKLANIEYIDGMIAKKYKIAIKPFITYAIPIVGAFFGSIYAIGILSLGFLLIDFLVMLLSKNNCNIASKILRIDLCFKNDSLLFRSEAEEKAYVESDEFKVINDPEYLAKLQSLGKIDISVSRDENIKKDNKK